MRLAASVLSAVILSACASSTNDPERNLTEEVVTPADDFNVTRKEIPETLRELETVYSPEDVFTCKAIAREVEKLDAVLGGDFDTPSKDEKTTEKARNMAEGAAVDAVSDVATGWLPFRGVVRRLSGASAYEARARKAVLRGSLRRAYLKGIGQSIGCKPPAAPKIPEPEEPEDAPVDYR